jgi:UDP-N-acetylmuramyl-tripeptide synthetase
MISIASAEKRLHEFAPFDFQNPEWGNIRVTGLAVDSRKVEVGNCFLAYPGHHSDGRDYLCSAFDAGASCALVEADGFSAEPVVGKPVVVVEGLQSKLGDIASKFYDDPSAKLKLCAITGTNGKTSVSQLVAHALHRLKKPCGVIGTLGNGMVSDLQPTTNTTPGVVDSNRVLKELLDQGAEFVVMETSSHGLVQGRVDGLKIDTALITNISRDHLDYHGTMEAYRDAKALLVLHPMLRNLILNADDDVVISMSSKVEPSVRVWSFSQRHRSDVSVCAAEVSYHRRGIDITVQYAGQQVLLHSALIGEFNGSNLLAAMTVLLAAGVSLSAAADALSSVAPVAGRMQMLKSCSLQPMVVVDFAHTPDALEKVILALRLHCAGRLWCVFGCGGDRDAGKRPIMSEIVCRLSDEAIITADNPRTEKLGNIIADMVKGVPEGTAFQVIEDRAQAVAHAVKNAGEHDVVLIAGKGHESYQEIDGVKFDYSDVVEATAALQSKGGQ